MKFVPRSVNIALGAPKIQIKYFNSASATWIEVIDFKGIARENLVR